MVGYKKYDMKKIIILILLLSESFMLNAQYQFRVSESDFQFSKASHHGFSVHIYESNIHDIEKGWKKMMKGWGAKIDEKKHEFFADNASFKKMGDNVFDTYAICNEKANYIEFVTAVDLGGAFLNSDDHREKTSIYKEQLLSFAKQTTLSALEEKAKIEENNAHRLDKELNQLIKDENKLKSDIESWKKSIIEAEKEVGSKQNEQELKKVEIQQQEKTVNTLKDKLKSIK